VSLAACLVLLGCPQRSAPPPPPIPAVETPRAPGTITMRDYHIRFPQQGARVWEADVRETQADPTQGHLTMTGIRCTLYQGGRATLRVSAEQGTATMQGNVANVQLRGRVRAVEITEGITLDAAAFAWNSATGKISADGLIWQMRGLRQQAEHGDFSTDLHVASFDRVRTDIVPIVSK
jgi:hypothetical protein